MKTLSIENLKPIQRYAASLMNFILSRCRSRSPGPGIIKRFILVLIGSLKKQRDIFA
jgi:hypothetical protein